MNNSISQKEHTDKELVEMTFTDANHFGQLIDRYTEKLSRYIRRITSVSDQDRDDILQDIFLKAYTNLNNFDNTLSFNSWIYRITHNYVIDWNRKHRNLQKRGYADIDDETLAIFSGSNSMEKLIDSEIDRQRIQNALESLQQSYREVLILKFIEGRSYSEISDILRKPEGTIGTMIHRAKQSFKKNYERT